MKIFVLTLRGIVGSLGVRRAPSGSRTPPRSRATERSRAPSGSRAEARCWRLAATNSRLRQLQNSILRQLRALPFFENDGGLDAFADYDRGTGGAGDRGGGDSDDDDGDNDVSVSEYVDDEEPFDEDQDVKLDALVVSDELDGVDFDSLLPALEGMENFDDADCLSNEPSGQFDDVFMTAGSAGFGNESFGNGDVEPADPARVLLLAAAYANVPRSGALFICRAFTSYLTYNYNGVRRAPAAYEQMAKASREAFEHCKYRLERFDVVIDGRTCPGITGTSLRPSLPTSWLWSSMGACVTFSQMNLICLILLLPFSSLCLLKARGVLCLPLRMSVPRSRPGRPMPSRL